MKIKKDIQISKNFTIYEFIRSETANNLGIDNTELSQSVLNNIERLVLKLLQPLRDMIGKTIKINSGYRCPALNQAVKGSATSEHLTGCAADITTDFAAAIAAIDDFDFNQFIIYKRGDSVEWIHLSYAETNRKEKLICRLDGNKKTYEGYK